MSSAFKYGDWVEHPQYGPGQFVRDDPDHSDAAQVAFDGSRWDFTRTYDGQPRTDFQLHGVWLFELRAALGGEGR